MKYLIIENGIIINIIIADENFANEIGAFSFYDNAKIGDVYNPPTIESINKEIKVLKSQLAQSDEVAISLYEDNTAQDNVNAQQDDAILAIYDKLGG